MKPVRPVEQSTRGVADYGSVERDSASGEGLRSHRSRAACRESRTVLVEDQRGPCGCCKIAPDSAGGPVEQVAPRSAGGSDRQGKIDIGDLIASCPGGTKRSPRPQAYRPPIRLNRGCGPEKGGVSIPESLDPRDLPAAPALYRVDPEGRIEPDAAGGSAAGIPASVVEDSLRLLGLEVERLRRACVGARGDRLRLSADHEDDAAAMEEIARQVLLSNAPGRLFEFFTTARSYFGAAAETVLAEAPGEWV